MQGRELSKKEAMRRAETLRAEVEDELKALQAKLCVFAKEFHPFDRREEEYQQDTDTHTLPRRGKIRAKVGIEDNDMFEVEDRMRV
jgi:hypothetical protein